MTSGQVPLSVEEMAHQLKTEPTTPPLPATDQNAVTPYLANSAPPSGDATSTQVADFLLNAKKWLQKLLAVGLVLQGLYGIYKSIYFIFVTYPELGFLLASHQISQTQVNNYVIQAILMSITTLVSMVFAMRLTILQNRVAQTFNTVIGVLLVIGNAALHDYFEALHASEAIINGIDWLINFLKSFPVLLRRALG